MALFSASEVHGDAVGLARTNPGHLRSRHRTPAAEAAESGGDRFGAMLLRALNGVNDLQLESDSLGQQMITDPDSVDAHDVTIAMSKASLAVSITKAVVDEALQAYQNIINIR